MKSPKHHDSREVAIEMPFGLEDISADVRRLTEICGGGGGVPGSPRLRFGAISMQDLYSR